MSGCHPHVIHMLSTHHAHVFQKHACHPHGATALHKAYWLPCCVLLVDAEVILIRKIPAHRRSIRVHIFNNLNHSLQLIMSLMFLEQGIGTDEHCLIEIMFTRTPAQIKEIRDIYESGKY